MHVKNMLWTIPFISFMGGYLLLQSYFGNNKTTVPLLVGKPIKQAVCLLSEHMLIPRIIAEKEDPHMPVGTIIQQKPAHGTSIRWHQTVMLTVSKLPDPVLVPQVVGKKVADMVPQLSKMGIQAQVYELPSYDAVQGVCFAQWPSAGHEIKPDGKLILYCSKNTQKPYIVPDFRGTSLVQAQQVCEQHAITCQVIHQYVAAEDHDCAACVVINQRPLPGTLLTFDPTKKLLFQFQV